MSDILNKTIVLVLNRNWQAINIRTPQDAFCQMATHVATGLDIEGENHIRPVTWEEWITRGQPRPRRAPLARWREHVGEPRLVREDVNQRKADRLPREAGLRLLTVPRAPKETAGDGTPAWPTFRPLSEAPLKPLEELFRAKVIHLLVEEKLLPPERVQIIYSWKHSGFNLHAGEAGRRRSSCATPSRWKR